NAVTFLASAALVASVPGRFSAERPDANEHRGLRAGFRFLAHDRVLRAITIGWVGIVLGMGLAMVADVPFVDLFRAGSVGYGVLIGCWGAGSVLGSLAGRWLNEHREPRVLVAGVALVAVMTIGVAVSPFFWIALLAVLF